MSRLQDGFLDEVHDTLNLMEQLLLSVGSHDFGREWVDAVFRAAHSVKGGAAALGLPHVVELMHVVESVLEQLRGSRAEPGVETVGLLLEVVEAVRSLLVRHQSGVGGDSETTDALAKRLGVLVSDSGPAAPAAMRSLEIRIGPVELLQDADAVVTLLRDFPGMGEIDMLPDGRTDGRSFAVRTDLSDGELLDLCAFCVPRTLVSIRVVPTGAAPRAAAGGKDIGTPIRIAGASMPAPTAASAIRIPTSHVDHLARLAGDFAMTQVMLRRSAGMRGVDDHAALLDGLDELRRNTQDLLQLALAMRMTPIAVVFQRFPRMLRELSGKLGKSFNLVIRGEDTQLERALAERIADPLSHLVRNSCDHGIEAPAERVAAGKPATGTVTLSAHLDVDAIVVDVRDDGQGLAREQIVAATLARGLTVPSQMTDHEVWQLVLLPGVSTAKAVTDISGRGVGMDVVQRNLTELGGTVEIDSVPGQGTTVRLRLPLSHALTQGLLVGVGGEPYFLARGAHAGCMPLDAVDVRTDANGLSIAQVQGEWLPAVDLHRVLGATGPDVSDADGLAVVAVAAGRKLALIARRWLGASHIVATSPTSPSVARQFISGAALLADGSVAPVLDAAALVRLGHDQRA